MNLHIFFINVILVMGMIIYGIMTMISPELGRISWISGGLSSLLGFFGLIRIFLSRTNQAPWFVFVLGLLMALTSISTLIQSEVIQAVAGIRRYHQMWGLVFALCAFRFKEKNFDDWLKFFWILGLIQVPVCIFQRVVLVPIREGMDIAFMVPIDVVAGTFGATMEGGGTSGEMALFMVVMLFGLYQFRRFGLISKYIYYISLVLFFIPVAIGETKAAIVYIFVGVFLIVRQEFKINPARSVGVIVIGVTIVLSYFMIQASQDLIDTPDFEQTLAYNFGEDPHGSRVLNRTTTIGFWFLQHSLNEYPSLLLGDGLGSAHDSDADDITGKNARAYKDLGIDLSDMSSYLWDAGVFGYVLLCLIYILAYLDAGRLVKKSTKLSFVAYCHTFRFFCIVGLVNTWVLRALSDAPVLQLFTAMMFGMYCVAIKIEREHRY